MSKNVKWWINIFFLSLFVLAGVALAAKYLIVDPRSKKKRRQQLINLTRDYFKQKEYSSAKNFTEMLLLEDANDPQLISLLSQINQAIKDQQIVVKMTEMKRAKAYQQQFFLKVKEELKPAKLIPADVSEQVRQGVNAYHARDYALAKNIFRKVLQIDPTDAYANAYLGASLFQENPESEKNIQEATKKCNAAIKKDPGIAIAHVTLANIYNTSRLSDLAMAEYEAACKLNPHDFESLFKLGMLHYNQKEYETAKIFFKNSINVKNDFANSYYYLALAEIKTNNMPQAKACLQKTLAIDPVFYQSYSQLADIYQLEKDWPNAIQYYEKANQIEKNHHCFYKTAFCYEKLEKIDQAIKNYHSAIRFNPGISDHDTEFILKIYKKIIILKWEDNKTAAALQLVKKAADHLDQKAASLHFLGGEIYMSLKEYKKAIKLYSQSLESTGDSVKPETIYYQLGLCYQALGQQAMMISALKKAIELNPDFQAGYVELAQCHMHKGNYKKAKDVLYLLLAKNPESGNGESIKNMLHQISNKDFSN